jgi:carbon storage regulator CsrA
MLVLARKLNESIVIEMPDGRRILVTVVGIEGFGTSGRAKVGIQADKDVRINRSEIQREIDADGRGGAA